MLAPVRKAVAAGAPDGVKRIGGAVLEYRLIYLDWPHAGDHVELRSGLRAFDDKTQRITHWLLDPVSGRPWAVSEAVAINLDLDARKIVPISAEAQKALKAFVSEGLTL